MRRPRCSRLALLSRSMFLGKCFLAPCRYAMVLGPFSFFCPLSLRPLPIRKPPHSCPPLFTLRYLPGPRAFLPNPSSRFILVVRPPPPAPPFFFFPFFGQVPDLIELNSTLLVEVSTNSSALLASASLEESMTSKVCRSIVLCMYGKTKEVEAVRCWDTPLDNLSPSLHRQLSTDLT